MWKLVNNNWEYLAIDEEPKKETKSSIEVAIKPKKAARKSRVKAKTA